ncbi:SdpI family protein [soil metagenome]
MNRLRTADLFAGAAIVLLFLGTLAVHGSLPDTMPMHLDLQGRADGFAPRFVGAWLLPVVASLTWALVRFRGDAVTRGANAWAGTLTVIFLGALHVLLLRMALSGATHAGIGLGVVLGLFSLFLGLLLPRIRRNRFIGIRLPWTLASDENWARTHHFAGRLFALGGVVTLLACAVSPSVGNVVAILAILATSIVASVHSYRIQHAER